MIISAHDPLHLPLRAEPNRIMKAAMSEALPTPGGSPGRHLGGSTARGVEDGYGLLVTGNVMLDRTQLGEPDNVVIEDDRDLDAPAGGPSLLHDAGVPHLASAESPGRGRTPSPWATFRWRRVLCR